MHRIIVALAITMTILFTPTPSFSKGGGGGSSGGGGTGGNNCPQLPAALSTSTNTVTAGGTATIYTSGYTVSSHSATYGTTNVNAAGNVIYSAPTNITQTKTDPVNIVLSNGCSQKAYTVNITIQPKNCAVSTTCVVQDNQYVISDQAAANKAALAACQKVYGTNAISGRIVATNGTTVTQVECTIKQIPTGSFQEQLNAQPITGNTTFTSICQNSTQKPQNATITGYTTSGTWSGYLTCHYKHTFTEDHCAQYRSAGYNKIYLKYQLAAKDVTETFSPPPYGTPVKDVYTAYVLQNFQDNCANINMTGAIKQERCTQFGQIALPGNPPLTPPDTNPLTWCAEKLVGYHIQGNNWSAVLNQLAQQTDASIQQPMCTTTRQCKRWNPQPPEKVTVYSYVTQPVSTITCHIKRQRKSCTVDSVKYKLRKSFYSQYDTSGCFAGHVGPGASVSPWWFAYRLPGSPIVSEIPTQGCTRGSSVKSTVALVITWLLNHKFSPTDPIVRTITEADITWWNGGTWMGHWTGYGGAYTAEGNTKQFVSNGCTAYEGNPAFSFVSETTTTVTNKLVAQVCRYAEKVYAQYYTPTVSVLDAGPVEGYNSPNAVPSLAGKAWCWHKLYIDRVTKNRVYESVTDGCTAYANNSKYVEINRVCIKTQIDANGNSYCADEAVTYADYSAKPQEVFWQ